MAETKKKQTSDDSMFEQLEDQRDVLNLLVYGEGGTGKTTLTAHMANGGRTLIINAEAGLKRKPLQRQGVDTSNLVVWPRQGEIITFDGMDSLFTRLLSDLEKDPDSWYGVGWDSLTDIWTKLLRNVALEQTKRAERVGKERDPFHTEQSDYQRMGEQVAHLLRRFRDLPCHFVATALERRDQDSDGSVKYGPAVTPMLQNTVFALFDVIGHTEVVMAGQDPLFTLYTQKGTKYTVKDRFGTLPRRLVEPSFDRVLDYVNEDLDEISDPVQKSAKEKAAQAKSEDLQAEDAAA